MPVEEMPSFSIFVIILLMLVGGCIGGNFWWRESLPCINYG